MPDDNFPQPIPQPAPVAEPPPPAEPPVEEPPAESAEPPKQPEKKDDDEKLSRSARRQIFRTLQQRAEAEARAKVAEEEVARLRLMVNQAPASRQPAGDEVPTIDKFSNIEDYVTAKAQWVARQQIQEALAENERKAHVQRSQSEAEQLHSTWQERVEKAVAETPDFEEVIGASQVPLSPAMERTILESDVGPKLAYWLAQNPQEAMKIANLPPIRAIAALGRIEERLSTAPPPVPKPSSAPPPVEPVGSRAKVSKNPDDMTTEEWMAWRNKQLRSS